MPRHAGVHGAAPGWVRRQVEGERVKHLYCGFCRREQVRQGSRLTGGWCDIYQPVLRCRAVLVAGTWPCGRGTREGARWPRLGEPHRGDEGLCLGQWAFER